MGLARGQIWSTDFGLPRGSAPALVRPALIVSADDFNNSGIRTATVVALTTNLRWAAAPGNVLLPAELSGLGTDSVVNVTQIDSVDRSDLLELVAELPAWAVAQVDQGLRIALALS